MIFITVGTHEQGLDRLLIEVDKLIENGVIQEEVFAQSGYSKYEPKNYKYKKMIRYDEMDSYIMQARIVITHGGPGSIFHPLQYGKVPIVVPRNPEFNEHVDNHQILFAKRLEDEKKIIAVYKIEDLKLTITNYKNLAKKCKHNKSSTSKFIDKFKELLESELKLV